MDPPIFGLGYRNDVNYVKSNSLFEMLTFGGIALGSIYFYPMVADILTSLVGHEKGLLIFHCVVLVDFIFTITGRTFVMLLMLSYFYSNLIFSSPVRNSGGQPL